MTLDRLKLAIFQLKELRISAYKGKMERARLQNPAFFIQICPPGR
jgi:hypothetical protein